MEIDIQSMKWQDAEKRCPHFVEGAEETAYYLAKIRMFLQPTRMKFRFFSYFCHTAIDLGTAI